MTWERAFLSLLNFTTFYKVLDYEQTWAVREKRTIATSTGRY
jgi:hypothetical protein